MDISFVALLLILVDMINVNKPIQFFTKGVTIHIKINLMVLEISFINKNITIRCQ